MSQSIHIYLPRLFIFFNQYIFIFLSLFIGSLSWAIYLSIYLSIYVNLFIYGKLLTQSHLYQQSVEVVQGVSK